MKKKVLIIIVSLFLAVLFLSTVGSIYTGNVVYTPDKTTLENYPYPFIKNGVPNSLYIVIPDFPEMNEYQAAGKISRSLKNANPIPPTIVRISDLPEGYHNLIVVGNPCDNSIIAQLLKTTKCTGKLNEGEGLIKLVNSDRTNTLIVSGYSSDDLYKAALVLANYNVYPLLGKEIVISGTKNSP